MHKVSRNPIMILCCSQFMSAKKLKCNITEVNMRAETLKNGDSANKDFAEIYKTFLQCNMYYTTYTSHTT